MESEEKISQEAARKSVVAVVAVLSESNVSRAIERDPNSERIKCPVCWLDVELSNRKGQHAVAICLLRQCAESLTIIELGLLRDFELGSALLDDWLHGKKKPGEIRKRLAERVWPNYGYGLWQETWSEFIREFGEALHAYAHYTSALQAWPTQSPVTRP